MSERKLAIGYALLLAGVASAGARLDLRPIPPVPPGGYAPGTLVQVDVWAVDTGNFQGDILFRGWFLDFADSSPALRYPGPDSSLGTSDDNEFQWYHPFGIAAVFPDLPYTSWVMPILPNPIWSILLPDEGETWLGKLQVVVPDEPGPYLLDARNADDPNINFAGARADFGFGGPNDPVTTWLAFAGDITGGTLELPVVPEPGTLMMLLVGLGTAAFRKNGGT